VTAAPQGWYPDPHSMHPQLRYWDGLRWTLQLLPVLTPETLRQVIDGALAPWPGLSLHYHQTDFSYRRPLSYEIRNQLGQPIAQLIPVDPKNRTVSRIIIGDDPALILIREQRGMAVWGVGSAFFGLSGALG
jgi:Protein of unknown function (DUF2510)